MGPRAELHGSAHYRVLLLRKHFAALIAQFRTAGGRCSHLFPASADVTADADTSTSTVRHRRLHASESAFHYLTEQKQETSEVLQTEAAEKLQLKVRNIFKAASRCSCSCRFSQEQHKATQPNDPTMMPETQRLLSPLTPVRETTPLQQTLFKQVSCSDILLLTHCCLCWTSEGLHFPGLTWIKPSALKLMFPLCSSCAA